MDDTNWIVPAIFGLIVAIAAVTFVIHMLMDHAKALRNRTYKSLDEHQIANGAAISPPDRRAN